MTALMKTKPLDPLDRVLDRVAEDWLFLCPSGEIANAVAQIGRYGLITDVYSPKTIRRIARGKKIVVVAPSGGPGRQQALEAMAECRAAGARVVREWCLLGLGVEFLDFTSWSLTFDLANCLWCEQPWLGAPATGADPEPCSRMSRTTSTDDDEAEITLPEWPAPPEEAAYHGLAGAIVRSIEPHSEADPAALLAQLLVAFGSMIGRSAHVRVGATWHHANEFALMVGETSAARKGTSWSEVCRFVGAVDPEWRDQRILGGLSTGAGLIYHVRDPLGGKEPMRDKGTVTGYQEVIRDHGVSDKRLLVIETEFGGVLKVSSREGNNLSAVMRQGWDGSTLASMTKSSPYRATGAHVSIIGHITAEELTRLLSQCDQANGFANRFLWVCCRRSKLLPFGGRIPPDEVDRLQARLSEAAAFARSAAMIQWTRPAMAIWDEVYPRLTSPRPGALGMVSSRAEAHTLRLALLYTLLDRSDRIEPEHLAAALALWDYCQRSAAYLFGTTTGDRDADRILEALRACSQGLSRGEIRRACFGDNKSADHVASKLTILLQAGSVRRETVATAGRPAERWFAVGDVVRGNVKNVISPQATGPRTPYHVFHVPTYQGPPEDHSPSAGPGAVAADPADSAAGAHREKPDVLDHRGVDPTDPDAF